MPTALSENDYNRHPTYFGVYSAAQAARLSDVLESLGVRYEFARKQTTNESHQYENSNQKVFWQGSRGAYQSLGAARNRGAESHWLCPRVGQLFPRSHRWRWIYRDGLRGPSGHRRIHTKGQGLDRQEWFASWSCRTGSVRGECGIPRNEVRR